MVKGPYLKTRDAAEYIGSTKSTMDTWRCRGEGPVYIKAGRSVRYAQTDLDDWMTRQRVLTKDCQVQFGVLRRV